MVVAGLSHASIAAADSIDGNVRVGYGRHRHIVEVVNWKLKLDIIQRYLLVVVVWPLVNRALRGSRLLPGALIRVISLLVRAVIIVWNREPVRGPDLLQADDLLNDVLGIAFVEILNEELV